MIIILGPNGMLGRYVVKAFEFHSNVNTIDRKKYNVLKEDISILKYYIDDSDFIINCIGAIPQRSGFTKADYIKLNSWFPSQLELLPNPVIHVSTDCVFSGKKGNYNESDVEDSTEIYGRSKLLGEPYSKTVIRTSIVGEEPSNNNGGGLLNWFIKNPAKAIPGYTNHFWNGLTCWSLAQYIYEMYLDKTKMWTGVRHFFSDEIYSKYELLKAINKVYGTEKSVISTLSEKYSNKTLCSEHTKIQFPSFLKQLEEQKGIIL